MAATQEPAPIGLLPSDDGGPTTPPSGGGGAFSDQRKAAQANRKRIDDRTLAGANQQRPVEGPPAKKAIADRKASPASIATRPRGTK
jgi:hypothetical protein